MHTPIASLDLAIRRKSLIGYTLGMVAYMLIVVALFPAFKDSASLDQIGQDSEGVAALFGVTAPLTSATGWIAGNAYTNFFPLIILLLTVGYGAFAIAGQERDGHLELVMSLPFSRGRVIGEKIGVLVVQATVFSLGVYLSVLVGRAFEVDIAIGDLTTATIGALLLGIDFGLLALAIAALTGSRGSALGITSAIAGASYLVASLAPLIDWAEPARYASLFYWSVSNDQLDHGLGWDGFAVMAGVGVVVAMAALRAFDRHDLVA